MRKSNVKSIFIFLAIIGLLVFLYFTDIFSPVKEKIYEALNPVAVQLYSFGSNINNIYQRQADKADLSKELEEFKKEVNELKVENAELKEVSEENEKLRSYLEFLEENHFSYKMAHVISNGFVSSPEESERDIIIDKGSADGLFSGLAVVDSSGALVGKISRVEEKVSRISLLTSSECKLAATIQGGDRTIGVASGKLGLTVNMGFINQDEDIEEKDLVVTSGLEEDVPRGLLIGEVKEINSNSNEIWKSVIIEPKTSFNDLMIVSVILP